ncbi:MAG: amidohydrolase [Planctomycetes bacterium]|nr:amidohydrolase [Planctomycetota bacterium]
MLIDCDVHNHPPSLDQWLEFLDEPYRSEVARWKGLRHTHSGLRGEGGSRLDADARTPQSVKEQLLDVYGHRYAILTGTYGFAAATNDPEYAAAVCRAYNDTVIKYWLPQDERFVMGLAVPMQDPLLAVQEIERLGDHPRVVCVLFWGASNRIPYGQRYFWPIYEACVRKGLPIHVHPSTTTAVLNHSTTPAGMATTYLEMHTCLPQYYMANTVSLIFEGVFELFPALKFALVEGGFGWAPHLMWRMDKEFKGLRQQAPRLKRLPSAYLRDHIKFGTQPIEEPQKAAHLPQLIDMLGGDEMLMFATDFPHWDFDPPSVLPKSLGESSLRRILHDNAAEFFRWPKGAFERTCRPEALAAQA